MTSPPDESKLLEDRALASVPADEVLEDIWGTSGDGSADADEDCGPTKVCRNARDFSFEGISKDGADLGTAWRDLLKAEGKLSDGGSSIRDIVLGHVDE